MSDFPSGTVTFLFTDVAGSTRLWQDHPDTAGPALSRHFALLRAAVEAEEGAVFKTIGDAVCAAFNSAPRAVAAALAAQQAIAAEAWGPPGPLRVRMALHCGEAAHQDGDYFGQPLNRVARLLAAAHGGQVLLSGAAHELVRDALPGGVVLRDLGEHQLKDLYRPEHIFQLLHAALPRDFPPLRTLDARPHNLPAQPTPLVGRDDETTQVAGLLSREDVRLVTVTGPGGVGKTRLSLQVGADLLEAFPDGCWFVDLAAIRDPVLLPAAIAGVVGVREEGGRSLAQALADHLKDRALLLILDNLEQLTAGAPTIADLLAAAARLKVLVTSRVRLGLRGEHEVVIDPLPTPDPKSLTSVDQLNHFAAVRLFIQRAEAAKPGFTVTNETAPAVAEICYRLDGLPLAIELAAARIKLFAPESLLRRLERRLPVLSGGARDLPTRQRTLRDAIAWSHDLLGSDEQALFRRLAVFAGGATFESAEAVTNPEGDLDVFETLPLLVDHSLVRPVERSDGEPRFAMLETIREFGMERLAQTGEETGIRRAHAEYMLTMVEAVAPELVRSEQVTAFARLDDEYANLRSALGWSLEEDEGEIALRFGAALWRYWMVRGLMSEGRRFLDRALAKEALAAVHEAGATALYGAGALAEDQHDFARATEVYHASLALCAARGDHSGMARARAGLGSLAITQGNLDEAETLYGQVQAAASEAGDRWQTMVATLNLGNIALYRGDLDFATAQYEAALGLLYELGDRHGVALALANLGVVAQRRGELERAVTHYQDSLVLSRELGSQAATAKALLNLGDVLLSQGEARTAIARLEEALDLFRKMGNRREEGATLYNLGMVALGQQEPLRATRLFADSLAIYASLALKPDIIDCLEALARTLASAGQLEVAARLFGAAEAQREVNGVPLPLDEEGEQIAAAARAVLAQVDGSGAWSAGRGLSLDDAIADALTIAEHLTRTTPALEAASPRSSAEDRQ